MSTAIRSLCNKIISPRKDYFRGDFLKKKNESNVRLDPETRLCPEFDSCAIKKFAAPDREEMGVRVLDDCAQEHQM